MDFKEKINHSPDSSGVYFFKGAKGEIIYVGKAASLKKRLASHFNRPVSPKSGALISGVRDIEYLRTSSEVEALLLEAKLIKQYKPKYNIQLRDDKMYPFIRITKEDFPLVCMCRPKNLKDKSSYFGPYTNSKLLRIALKQIRSVFPYRTCRNMPKSACLNYALNLCPAPCVMKITKNDYAYLINAVKLFLEGKKKKLLGSLYNQMKHASINEDFEEAAKIRDKIRALELVYFKQTGQGQLGELQALKDFLRLKTLPLRIEAFDISNIFGNQAVGSMVSFSNGLMDKSNYRRFKIKTVKGIDDFSCMAEVLRRRYTRLKNENSAMPDLIIVDGGKGHVMVAKKELDKLGIDISLIGIAKENEEIYLPYRNNPLKIEFGSRALQFIQRIRDEAHRFAISYHKLLRKKNMFERGE